MGRNRAFALGVLVTLAALTPPAFSQEAAASTFYFADGSTRPGFVEQLTVLNLSSDQATVDVIFSAADAAGTVVEVPPLSFSVGPRSRATRSVNDHIGKPLDVSMRLTSNKEIVAERTMYFRTDLAGGASGVSTLVGTTKTVTDAYFPEGTVRTGFQQFFSFYNPGTINSRVRVEFTASNDSGQAVPITTLQVEVPPGGRESRDVNQFMASTNVPTPLDASAHVIATEAVVAERTVYFKSGLAGGVEGATASNGITRGDDTWYFAAGRVGSTDAQVVSLMNLADQEADLTFKFRTFDTDGTELKTPDLEVKVPAKGRAGRDVNAYMKERGLLSDFDVSMEVRANRDIVVERSTYTKSTLAGGVSGGGTSPGSTLPGRRHDFPATSVGANAETILTFLNTGDSPVDVTVSFYATSPSGEPVKVPDLILEIDDEKPRAERSLSRHLADSSVSGPVELAVRVSSDSPILAERSIYVRSSLAGGVQGATTTFGFSGKDEVSGPPFLLIMLGVGIVAITIGAVVVGFSRGKAMPQPVEPTDVPERQTVASPSG